MFKKLPFALILLTSMTVQAEKTSLTKISMYCEKAAEINLKLTAMHSQGVGKLGIAEFGKELFNALNTNDLYKAMADLYPLEREITRRHEATQKESLEYIGASDKAKAISYGGCVDYYWELIGTDYLEKKGAK